MEWLKNAFTCETPGLPSPTFPEKDFSTLFSRRGAALPFPSVLSVGLGGGDRDLSAFCLQRLQRLCSKNFKQPGSAALNGTFRNRNRHPFRAIPYKDGLASGRPGEPCHRTSSPGPQSRPTGLMSQASTRALSTPHQLSP